MGLLLPERKALIAVNHTRRVALSLPQLWAFVTLAGVFVVLALGLIRPHDFWWHARVGQWIVEHRRVPTTDLFSYTQAGTQFAYQSWLMDVCLYGLLRAGGEPLVLFVHAAMITGAYALLLRVNVAAAGGDLRWGSVATLAAAAVGVTNWNVRPQTVSFPLFALVLYLLERAQRTAADKHPSPHAERALWLLPAVFVVWANAHGGFVFGLGLLGAYALAGLVGWRRQTRAFPRTMILVLVCSLLGSLLTPLGFGMVDYLLGFLRHPITQTLNREFMPPTVRTLTGRLFLGFVVVWVAALMVGGHRLTRSEAIRTLLFGGLALMATRSVAWFGFVAAPARAASLSEWASARRARGSPAAGRPRINRVLLGLVGLLVVLSLPWLRPYVPLPAARRAYVTSETPVEAVAYVRNMAGASRLFHAEGYGSYMIWASPELPVFIDTRFELYPAEQWLGYLAVSAGRYDWEAILERYQVDTLLLARETQTALVEAASGSGRWQRVYDDDRTVIFRRGVASEGNGARPN